MSSGRPILYNKAMSSCSWRVRIALAYKAIDYEYRAVSPGGFSQYSQEYRRFNASALVPTLAIDGLHLGESLAIIDYLDETRPSLPRLLPSEPGARAAARALALHITAGIQPLQNGKVLRYLGADKATDWAKLWIEDGLTSLEAMLEKTAGTFCVGDELTVADCCLAPQVYNADFRFGIDLTKFPLTKAIYTRLLDLDCVKSTHPKCQPDA